MNIAIAGLAPNQNFDSFFRLNFIVINSDPLFAEVNNISVNKKNEFAKSTQLTFTCSDSAIETLEKGLKYVQS